MATHMIRLFIESGQGNLSQPVDNWVQNFNEWTGDPVDHTLVETNTEPDGTGTDYYRGDYRFIQDSTKTAVLDDLEQRLQNFQGGMWYRMGYHVCDHDEDDGTACGWEDQRENGTIPSDIPALS